MFWKTTACSLLLLSIQYSDSDPSTHLPVPPFLIISPCECKVFDFLRMSLVSGSSESRSQEKQTSSSLPSGQRCPWDSSCVCHQLSDQISVLKSVSSPAPACRQVHGFALKWVAKQQREHLERSAGTYCPWLPWRMALTRCPKHEDRQPWGAGITLEIRELLSKCCGSVATAKTKFIWGLVTYGYNSHGLTFTLKYWKTCWNALGPRGTRLLLHGDKGSEGAWGCWCKNTHWTHA